MDSGEVIIDGEDDGLMKQVEDLLLKKWTEKGFTANDIANWTEAERRKQILLAIPPPDKPSQGRDKSKV